MTHDLSDSSPDADLAELVSKYLDNRLTSSERKRLETRIQEESSAMEYLAKRLRFEATLRETINPQRMEVLESRRMIMDPGSDGLEWSVEEQRSVRIGRKEEHLAQDVELMDARSKRWLFFCVIPLALIAFAWLLLPRAEPQITEPTPTLLLRNADFEITDLSLTPQGYTSTLVSWQEAFACPQVELVEIARYSKGAVFPKSGKNVVRLMPGGYINQFLHYNDGTSLRARNGLTVKLCGWAWTESAGTKTVSTSLRVVASGRPDTILYDACRATFTLDQSGWQPFSVNLPVRGNLMRSPYWTESTVSSKPPLDLTDRELCLSIDMDYINVPILLDDLQITEVHSSQVSANSSDSLELHHSLAKISGPAYVDRAKDCIGAWEDEKTTISWSIAIDQSCEIIVECLQAAEARSAGNGYDVIIGRAKASGKVIDTGSWETFQHVTVGRIKIPAAGEYKIVLVPHPKNTQAVMNFRSLRLIGVPASAEVLSPSYQE